MTRTDTARSRRSDVGRAEGLRFRLTVVLACTGLTALLTGVL